MAIFEKGRQTLAPPPTPVPPRTESSASNPGAERNRWQPTDNVATIGSSITVRGEIVGSEPLSVEGTVEGTIELLGNEVSIQPGGSVIADVTSDTIVIAGEARGDLRGNEKVVLKEGARVQGDITAPRVSLEDGARFNGRIDMGLEDYNSSAEEEDSESEDASVADLDG